MGGVFTVGPDSGRESPTHQGGLPSPDDLQFLGPAGGNAIAIALHELLGNSKERAAFPLNPDHHRAAPLSFIFPEAMRSWKVSRSVSSTGRNDMPRSRLIFVLSKATRLPRCVRR